MTVVTAGCVNEFLDSQEYGCIRSEPSIMRILIAEDDTALASFVRKGLEAEHYAVDVSSDGEQARAMATEFDYDLMVLDLNLPRLDGGPFSSTYAAGSPTCPSLF
jgi:DNA-binding response OmpR family regulator